MFKKLLILPCLLLISSCSYYQMPINNEKIDEVFLKEETNSNELLDDNPIKIALYQKNEGIYNRQDKFLSKMEAYKDIGLFSIILSNEKVISGESIKKLYNEYKNGYDNFLNYKIGYSIKFSLSNGQKIQETILKPKGLFTYSFSDYLYIWLYDDINNTGYYSHLESFDYNDNTVMSSIKLMSTSLSQEIISPIEVQVFTYDDNDFDEVGNYLGNSKFTLLIEKY